MSLAQFAQGLDQQAAQPPSRFHILWRRPAKLNRGRADLDRPGRTVGQEHDLRWHLFGQAKGVRRVCSCGLKPCSRHAAMLGDRLGGRFQGAKDRVFLWEIIDSAGQSPNSTVPDARMSATSTASRLPIPRKSTGTKTEPRPCFWIAARILESMANGDFFLPLM